MNNDLTQRRRFPLKLVTLLLFIIASMEAILFTGCDETGTMVKPVMEDHAVTPEPEKQQTIMISDMKEEAVREDIPTEPTETETTDTPETPPPETDVSEVAETPEKPTEEPTVETAMEPQEMQPPTVVEISHYSNGGLTKPLMGTIQAGRIVFTKVVFSGDVPYMVGNDNSALPDIRYVLDGREMRYDVLPRKTRQSQVRSGDCKPIREGTTVFLCRKSIPGHIIGEFSVNVGGVPFDDTSLAIEPPPPPPPRVTVPPTLTMGADGKTALQLEVEAAEAAGLVGNSPLVRAIQITNQLDDDYQEYRNIADPYFKKVHKILEEEIDRPTARVLAEGTLYIKNISVGTLLVDLIGAYYDGTNTSIIEETDGHSYVFTREPISTYWLTIEFLRIYFEDQLHYGGDANYASLYARFINSAHSGRLSIKFRDEVDVPKTPIQREVAAAEAAGLVGNSPLVQAIIIVNRISDRIGEIPSYKGYSFEEWLPFFIGPYSRHHEEVTGHRSLLFSVALPSRYFKGTNTEYQYGFSRYWMTIEFLRLSFEDPSANEQTLLDRFEESVRQGRISLEPRER